VVEHTRRTRRNAAPPHPTGSGRALALALGLPYTLSMMTTEQKSDTAPAPTIRDLRAPRNSQDGSWQYTGEMAKWEVLAPAGFRFRDAESHFLSANSKREAQTYAREEDLERCPPDCSCKEDES
jgi:hypothetical protein